MHHQSGKIIILAGAVIVLIGIVWYFFGNKLHFLGRLPGDIRIERNNFRFYFPITTMIVASLCISLLMYLLKKFL